MPAVRRKAKRRWPRAAAVALGLAGGCLSAVPPVVPPGWSVHFHQDTPYFYNENTGETTWEQPRPTTTAAAATATSASTDDRAPPASRRERSQRPPARGDGRPSSPSPAGGGGGGGGGGTRRGWFGFGGRNAAKPHEQPETLQSRRQQHPQHPQQRWEDPRAAPGVEGPQEQWHAAGDRGWTRSPEGLGEREVEAEEEEEEEEEVVPAAPRGYARSSRHGWGPEGKAAGAWDPLAGSGSPRGADEGDRGLAAAGDGEDLSTAAAGHGIAAGSDVAYAAGERAGGSSAGADAGAAEEFYSTRPGGVVRGDALDEQLGGEHEGYWASSTVGDTGTGVAPEFSSGGGGADAVPAAAGGHARDRARDPMDQSSGGGGEDTYGETATPSTAATAATEATEAGKDGAAVPAPAPAPRTTKTDIENEHAAPPALAAAGDTMGEWLLPSQRQPQQHQHQHQQHQQHQHQHQQEANQKPANLEHGAAAPAWKEPNPGFGTAGLLREGDAEGGREGAEVDGSGGEALPGVHPGGVGSTGGGDAGRPGVFSLEHEERFSGSQDKQYAGRGVGHEAEGWDWADPWGQADTWGTPAWKTTAGTGTNGATGEQPDDSALTPHSSTHPAGASASAAAGAAAGSGWGYGSGGDGSGDQLDTAAALARENMSAVFEAGVGEAGSSGGVGDRAAEGLMRQEEAAKASELERTLAEARADLEAARKAEAGLRAALKGEEEAKAAALAEAAAAAEKTRAAEAFARRQAEEARENATAAGQWLVTLGLEREELRGQLVAAKTNSTSLLEELSALKESSVEAEIRANSSEAKLKVALADVEVLDEGLKQFMDGEGQSHRPPRAAPLSWRRVSATYLRPLLPSKLKAPTPEELESLKLNRSLGRALENNTALAEAVSSKDDLIKDLNSRIKQFQLHAVRRKKGYRALKLGLAKLTDEVQAKESMLTILAVSMFGTSSILESMAATLDTQQANIAELVELSREREEKIKALTLELDSGAMALRDLRESLHRTESALSAVAASFGAREECLQRWKDTAASGAAPGQAGDDGPLGELLHVLHAAAAKKFLSPLGLEPSTGAITVAVPRTVDGGVQVGGRGKRRSGFWAGALDVLCCRPSGGGRS